MYPAVVFPDLEDGSSAIDTTRIVFDPEEDAFFIQQGPEVTSSVDCPVEASVKLTHPQLVQLFQIIQHDGFINAVCMAANDFNRKHLH